MPAEEGTRVERDGGGRRGRGGPRSGIRASGPRGRAGRRRRPRARARARARAHRRRRRRRFRLCLPRGRRGSRAGGRAHRAAPRREGRGRPRARARRRARADAETGSRPGRGRRTARPPAVRAPASPRAGRRRQHRGVGLPARGRDARAGLHSRRLERARGRDGARHRRERHPARPTARLRRRGAHMTLSQKVLATLVASLAAASLACGGGGDAPEQVVLVTHDSFVISDDVRRAFRTRTGMSLRILQTGDAGEALTKALLTAGNPQGDVLFGVDSNLLSRALEAELFEPYEPPQLDRVDERYLLDPEHRAVPIDHGEVCLNYDRAWFAERNVAPPASLEDLTEPAYKGLLVVENAATST